MPYTYRITQVDPAEKRIDVYFKVFKNGRKLGEDSVQISSNALADQPSDGRIEYVQSVVAEACKKFMVVEDVKTDFSILVGNDYTLDGVVYETKAERLLRISVQNAELTNGATV